MGQLTKYYQTTYICLFIFDSVPVITCLVKSVFLYFMVGGNEQRVAIKFFFKASLSATETLILVQKA